MSDQEKEDALLSGKALCSYCKIGEHRIDHDASGKCAAYLVRPKFENDPDAPRCECVHKEAPPRVTLYGWEVSSGLIDIEAIRRRNEESRLEGILLPEPHRSIADIDVLLAEVERLRADAERLQSSLSCIHCAAERDRGVVLFCVDHIPTNWVVNFSHATPR